jgi:hypothetical protein
VRPLPAFKFPKVGVKEWQFGQSNVKLASTEL